MNKGMWLLSLLLILGGIGCLAYGSVLLEIRRRKELYKGHTKARIIGFEAMEDPDNASGFSNSYFPVLEYYAGGKLHTSIYEEGSYPSSYRVGEEFDLAYDPQDPLDYIIVPRTLQSVLPTILNTAGALMLTAGAIIFICFAFRT